MHCIFLNKFLKVCSRVWPIEKLVWLASKNYQIISKNYEIFQRGHIAFLEPRKNISKGWHKSLDQDWEIVDFSQTEDLGS